MPSARQSPTINAGRLGHNDRLPAERMMSAHFATTRITLREALGQLEARGVIYREERRGWFGGPPRVVYNPLQRSHFHAMARDQGRRPATLVLDAREVEAPAMLCGLLALPPAARVYRIRRVRQIDGRAVLYVEHYLNPAFFPAILQQDLTASLTELYATRYDIRYGRVRFDMCPTTFPAAASLALKVAENSPALFITRINRDQHGRIIDCDLEYWRYDALHVSVEAQ
ncbi:UTRA domain-containing protein [Candidatus Sodalis endolongispinus]|uniref:UTRA domain-containing protein n=1 Tax=Candidatus Sodalis endolongispinus TaxID=2812662 RepID=A0ABS5YB06_9GAMM|nr:UTRA domain-containing protein [Candidatus Sodalis endolongispinus]MBT9432162.1 UTRA domain-containing protein [Candidatus Sodalis endolongispinus]